jgi:hypothetical protein
MDSPQPSPVWLIFPSIIGWEVLLSCLLASVTVSMQFLFVGAGEVRWAGEGVERAVGILLWVSEGSSLGSILGFLEGSSLGFVLGFSEGSLLGGSLLGISEGSSLGSVLRFWEGSSLGLELGFSEHASRISQIWDTLILDTLSTDISCPSVAPRRFAPD